MIGLWHHTNAPFDYLTPFAIPATSDPLVPMTSFPTTSGHPNIDDTSVLAGISSWCSDDHPTASPSRFNSHLNDLMRSSLEPTIRPVPLDTLVPHSNRLVRFESPQEATNSPLELSSSSTIYPDGESLSIFTSEDFSLSGMTCNSTISSTNSTESEAVLHCQVPDCSMSFRGKYRKGNMARHMRHRHSSSAAHSRCADPECNKVFNRSDSRLKHYRRCHPSLATDATFIRRPGAHGQQDHTTRIEENADSKG